MSDEIKSLMQPKRLAWADYSDDEDIAALTNSSDDELSMEDFVKTTVRNLQRVTVNPKKDGISQSFALDDATVDIMYRGQFTMVVSFAKQSSSDKHEEASESSLSDDNTTPEEPAEPADSSKDSWETVTSKNNKRRPVIAEQELLYYVFRDAVNDPYLNDLIQVVPTLLEAQELAAKEPWAHIYCPKWNKAYDYRRGTKEKEFKPDNRYHTKWDRFMANGVHDARGPFFVFSEGPESQYDWTKHQLRTEVSMNGVRAAVKKILLMKKNSWAHAYCPDKDELVIFCIDKQGRFMAKYTDGESIPGYQTRFHRDVMEAEEA